LQIGLTALSENQQGGSEVEQQKIVRVGIEEQSGNRSQQHDTKKKIRLARTSEQGFSSGKKNQMATKSKIEPELQTIKLPGTTTIRTHRTPEKSKEEKPVAHTISKNQNFHFN
jgi:hypothetical protein